MNEIVISVIIPVYNSEKYIKKCITSVKIRQKPLKIHNFDIERGQKNDSQNMRTIYSSSDNLDNASYETYLRGELSSYSENTVVLYGRTISLYSKYKKNFVEEVIKTSKFLYL
jgi:hypothetical protein